MNLIFIVNSCLLRKDLILIDAPQSLFAENAISFPNLVAIITLIITILFFWLEQRRIEQRSLNERKSRLSTLYKEIELNFSISNNIILKYDGESTVIHEDKFETEIIKYVLSSGDIIDSGILGLLWDTYRFMKLVNSLTDRALGVMYSEHIVDDPYKEPSKSGRGTIIKKLKKEVLNKTEKAKNLLEKLQKINF